MTIIIIIKHHHHHHRNNLQKSGAVFVQKRARYLYYEQCTSNQRAAAVDRISPRKAHHVGTTVYVDAWYKTCCGEIEDFVETILRKLCVILRLRVLPGKDLKRNTKYVSKSKYIYKIEQTNSCETRIRRNSPLEAVCDTSIPRTTGCIQYSLLYIQTLGLYGLLYYTPRNSSRQHTLQKKR